RTSISKEARRTRRIPRLRLLSFVLFVAFVAFVVNIFLSCLDQTSRSSLIRPTAATIWVAALRASNAFARGHRRRQSERRCLSGHHRYRRAVAPRIGAACQRKR